MTSPLTYLRVRLVVHEVPSVLLQYVNTFPLQRRLLQRGYEERFDEVERRGIDKLIRRPNHADDLAREVGKVFGGGVVDHLEERATDEPHCRVQIIRSSRLRMPTQIGK